MAAVVGGRLEPVVRPRSLFTHDYLAILVLAAVSFGIHAWLIAHTAVTARDSIGFARYALRIQSPGSTTPLGEPKPERITGIDIIARAEQPPAYPVAVWITAKFVRNATTLELPDSTLLATQVVSGLASVLLVIPMYLIGRMLFGRAAGFAAALLFQVLPVPARLTSDGLTEGLYLLAMATAVMVGVRAVRRPGVGGFLLCGLATGCAYLVRPEGVLAAGAVAAVAGWFALTRRWQRDLACGRIAALGVGVAMVAFPYMVLIGGISNKPSPGMLLNPASTPEKLPWLKGGTETSATAGPTGPLFAKWMNPPIEGIPARLVWSSEAVVEETIQSLHYLPAAFAVLGLVLLRRRIGTDPGLLLLLVLAGLNAGLLLYLASRVGYVSERHTVLLVMIGCLFAGAAFKPLALGLSTVPVFGRWWSGKYAWVGLLAMLTATALPSTFKPLHANREGHKHAGRWLASHVKDGDCLIDPFEWAQWYAWRSLYYIPKDPPADPPPEFTYAVVDDKLRADEHVRLPRMPDALNVVADGRSEVVYHWPENVPVEKAKVKVYRLIRK